MSEKVTVLGDGGWGTALAVMLAQQGVSVRLWGPFPEAIETMRNAGQNRIYLPGISLPDSIEFVPDRAAAVKDASVVILAIPTRYARDVLESFVLFMPIHAALVSVAKGFDPQTHACMTELIGELFPDHVVAALTGPSHAEEVARGIPTAVTLAAHDQQQARRLQALFMNPRFRVYTTDDVLGVELGGALKNVIALAVGIADGLGFGDNTRAALMTRGIAEITRLGVAMGSRHETFAGLSGVGDLIVTCTSRHSRNRAVGERLGKGESMTAINSSMQQIAEGVWNCAIAYKLARSRQVSTPIIDQVNHVIHHGKNPKEAVAALMEREPKAE